MHTLTLSIQDENVYQQLMQIIQSLSNINILEDKPTTTKIVQDNGLDFGQFPVSAFKNIDAVAYQRAMRDEW